MGTLVVLLDRDSFVGRADDDSRAELSAVRHALAEYDIAHHLLRADDDIAEVLGGATRRRTPRPTPDDREQLMPERLRRYLQPREGWLSAGLLMVMLLSLCWSRAARRMARADASSWLPVAFWRAAAGDRSWR